MPQNLRPQTQRAAVCSYDAVFTPKGPLHSKKQEPCRSRFIPVQHKHKATKGQKDRGD
jgi:hypothetical protein